MGYEIDYLAVGEGEKSADAICLRYGNLFGTRNEQIIITIDGGTIESGDMLVEHVRKYYKTDKVDIAMLSHPDTDHASGMRQIIEKLKVDQVVMHLPWNHSADVKQLIEDGRTTTNSIQEKAKQNLSTAHGIEQMAKRKGIPVVEPFAGDGNQQGLSILGPTREFYQEMLARFKFMPEAEAPGFLFETFFKSLEEGVKSLIQESWFSESLKEPDAEATSPENNSSVIFMLTVDGRKLLFTGDAGVPALESAVNYADRHQIMLDDIRFFDVPHHGSRRNLGPSILNRLFGNVQLQDSHHWHAFISAAKDGVPKHPNKKIINALRRRGAKVAVTAGKNIWHYYQAPPRSSYTPLEVIPFFHEVEEDD